MAIFTSHYTMKKTILITGTSSGIGKATALKFASEGWSVVATMRSPEKETELTQRDNVLVTRLDVQHPETIAAAIEGGIAKFGRIDVLVNNAGYGVFAIGNDCSLPARKPGEMQPKGK